MAGNPYKNVIVTEPTPLANPDMGKLNQMSKYEILSRAIHSNFIKETFNKGP